MTLLKYFVTALLLTVSVNVLAVPTFELPYNKWKMISLPATPPDSANTVASILGDDLGESGSYNENWVVYAYNTETNSYGTPLAETDVLEKGKGYWIVQKIQSGVSVTLDMPAGSTETPSTELINLAASTESSAHQWNLVGNPLASSLNLGDLRLITNVQSCSDGGCDLDDAQENTLLNGKVWTYSDSRYVPKGVADQLEAWQGFWVIALEGSQNHTLALGINSNRTLNGVIKNQVDGTPLPGIEVQVGSHIGITTAAGTYSVSVDNALPERVVVNVRGNGFATTGETIDIPQNETAALGIDLLPVAFTGTFNPAQVFTAQVENSPAQVLIEANSLRDETGNLPAAGDITAILTPIDPSLDIDLMPGDMTVETGEPIQSFGALTAEFIDAAGNELNLAPGTTATIRIPVADKGIGAPATIPLYYYDNEQGFWVKEGSAILTTDASGTYYEGTVQHFSTWNADMLFNTIAIKGCVQNETGSKVANALINMEGSNYNGMASTQTDAEGNFTVSAMRNAVSLIMASTSSQVSNTIKVGDNESTATDIVTIADCLILGETPLSVRLTWGQNPDDLDTHVTGPNYHIFYGSKGSLTSEPFGQLDVDDTSSFGPEVFTALRFPEAGTYHYTIHRFSGSSDIGASPAKVELTLDGSTIEYFPPSGTALDWWHVFDIVVNASGDVTITDVSTWSVALPGSSESSAESILPAKK